jgi:hypothetical protein
MGNYSFPVNYRIKKRESCRLKELRPGVGHSGSQANYGPPRTEYTTAARTPLALLLYLPI